METLKSFLAVVDEVPAVLDAAWPPLDAWLDAAPPPEHAVAETAMTAASKKATTFFINFPPK
jgi:hypothetical protein